MNINKVIFILALSSMITGVSIAQEPSAGQVLIEKFNTGISGGKANGGHSRGFSQGYDSGFRHGQNEGFLEGFGQGTGNTPGPVVVPSPYVRGDGPIFEEFDLQEF